MVLPRTDVEASAVKEEISLNHLFKVTGLSTTNLEKLAKDAVPKPSDFEEAIAATGYGKFNVALLLCTLPGFWSGVSVTASVSYIFTKAQCDMQLSLVDMGTVHAITYGGMISSALIWGFLSDTLGRKKIMVWGFICTGLVEVVAAMSQSFTMLLITRFAGGFLFNGPSAILISYIAEVHRTELRARVMLLSNLFYTLANTILPLHAWSILTNDWTFEVFGKNLVIHSWNLFMLSTAMIPLLSGIAFIFMPESPKFLMSRGRNTEAMEVLRKIYKMNTGNDKQDYPITMLVEEKTKEQARGLTALRGGWAQLLPLFKPPHVTWLIVICMIHAGCMFGSNTLRLWFPQLAAMTSSNSEQSLCSAIAPSPAPSSAVEEPGVGAVCTPIETNIMTYLQAAVVGAGSLFTYVVGGMLVNKCGKKRVAAFCGVSAALFTIAMPTVGTQPASLVAIVTSALAFTSLCGATLASISVDLFPTSLRVMAMATFFMSGRAGTISGTTIFPALIAYGCLPPFLAIASVLTVCGICCFLLPNTNLKKLE